MEREKGKEENDTSGWPPRRADSLIGRWPWAKFILTLPYDDVYGCVHACSRCGYQVDAVVEEERGVCMLRLRMMLQREARARAGALQNHLLVVSFRV